MIELGKLPNLRRFIVPDEGKVLIDMDLQRADLYVVAWDSGCKLLQERLQREDVHTTHANEFLGKATKRERDILKKLAHAGDYLVGPRKASIDTGLPESKIRAFLSYWYGTYPEIGGKDAAGNLTGWHGRIQSELLKTRTVHNAFGFRRIFFDRISSCLPEGVAWIPQSTVGTIINKALCVISEQLPNEVQVLLQVHDSLTMQVDKNRVGELIPQIEELSLIEVPYPNPLVIPVEFKVSDKTWGDVEKWEPESSQRQQFVGAVA